MAQSRAPQQQQGFQDYKIKLANVSSKKYHIMRFKPPHMCDLEKLVNPTLDRQAVAAAEEAVPDTGEGSEYGRKRREEARRRKRGLAMKKADPDNQPWVLREQKSGGKHFVGRREGTVNTSSSYYILTVGEDGAFEAYPVQNWYDFVPPVKYNYLNEEEAEERFERRNKTLNYFSIMLSKKIKEQEGEEEEGGGGKRAKGEGNSSKGKKKKEADMGLLLTDSDTDFSSDGEDRSEEASSSKLKSDPGKAKQKRKTKKKAQQTDGDSEAGEETDEGETESREVDYMSDTSSGSEQEFQSKQAIKEVPKDDEDLERLEQGQIDKGFTESSSSSEEEELTEEGKELMALMKKQAGEEDESSSDEGENPDTVDKFELLAIKVEGEQLAASSSRQESETGSKKGSPKKLSPRKTTKREREQEKLSAASSTSATPPPKKQKTESASTITEDEVRRYLSRRPVTSRNLVKKFLGKKSEMDKNRIVAILGEIIQKMKNVEKQTIKGKLYLSLKAPEQ